MMPFLLESYAVDSAVAAGKELRILPYGDLSRRTEMPATSEDAVGRPKLA